MGVIYNIQAILYAWTKYEDGDLHDQNIVLNMPDLAPADKKLHMH